MQQQSLSTPVQNLFKIGINWDVAGWLDYTKVDVHPEHIPELISIIRSTAKIWDDVEEFSLGPTPETWAPLHAWRALGQFHSVEAIPALLDLLDLIETHDADIIQEELPTVFLMIGPAAIPALTDYLKKREHEQWALLCAAEALEKIADLYPQERAGVVNTLSEVLRGYGSQNETFNGYLADRLRRLKAVEAAPLVEEAFQAGRIDEQVFGDWEDYQVSVGLLKKRLTPRSARQTPPGVFADGIDPEDVKAYRHEQHEKSKEKNKRKQAKVMRAKSRKKKKK